MRNLKAHLGVSRGENSADDEIIRRILAAYLYDRGPDAVPTAMWERIYDTQQAPLHEILVGGNLDRIKALLRRPGDSTLFHGFEGAVSAKSAQLLRSGSNHSSLKTLGLAPHDHLVRLAEIVGALRVENPERKSRAAYGLMPTDDVLDAIDRRLSTKLHFPNPYPDEIGTLTRRGVMTFRTVQAIYQAWRIHSLLAGVANPRVLEIGGGLGRTAQMAWQMGTRDYTVIDLPFTAVSQAYFLMRTLGEENVRLHGESDDGVRTRVKLLQPAAFLESTDRYDLIVNVDSLPEMSRPTAEKYWERIREAAPRFLSINQEAEEFTVQDLADADTARIRRYLRYPSGLRKGYIEEIFDF